MINDSQVLNWLLSGDTGLSSKAMLAAALAAQGDVTKADLLSPRPEHPYDEDDFGRCYRLIEAIPEVADHMDAIAKMSPTWRRMVAAWPELSATWRGKKRQEVYLQLLALRGL